MSIPEKDIKKLWGAAAGRCSEPTCDEECITFLESSNSVVIGEMAHVIAESPNGPRGIPEGGDNTYENLILLCPKHHKIIDKAPAELFPVELLLKWKSEHEEKVRQFFSEDTYENKNELCKVIKRYLIVNYQIWKTYGPESEIARKNPASNAALIWKLRKLDKIIPNNRGIINLINRHESFFTSEEYTHCCEFIEHAEGFELSTYERRDSVPTFPQKFQEVIDNNV